MKDFRPFLFGLALMLSVWLAGSCRRVGLAQAQADQERGGGRGDLFHWGAREPKIDSQEEDINLYVGKRPDCAPRFRAMVPLAEIFDRCPVKGRPIVFHGPTWCRYRFEQGSFVIIESPSFAYLRQSLVEGATIRTSAGWGFVWTNSRGISSVVVREPDGTAMVIQAPGSICSRNGLVQLALEAAARLDSDRTGHHRP